MYEPKQITIFNFCRTQWPPLQFETAQSKFMPYRTSASQPWPELHAAALPAGLDLILNYLLLYNT